MSLVASLCVVAGSAYAVILFEGLTARATVADWYPTAERLGSDALRLANATAYSQYGFVDLGKDFRLPSQEEWALEPAASGPGTAPDYLFIVADEPLFYGPQGVARITLSGRAVGEIRARSAENGGGPYVADRGRTDLLVPPERALGYAFPVSNLRARCAHACTVAIDGTFVFWRIYRIGTVGESGRFNRIARR